MILLFLFITIGLLHIVSTQSLGEVVRAPVVLTEGQYLENCVGDRAGLLNGVLTVRTASNAIVYKSPNPTQFTYLAVDNFGNLFLQRGSDRDGIVLLSPGDGTQFLYQLVLDNWGDLVLSNLGTMLVNYATEGNREQALPCPPTGCDVPAEGDCLGCINAKLPPKATGSCVYCVTQRTCFQSPMYACPPSDKTINSTAGCSTTLPPRTPGVATSTTRPTTPRPAVTTRLMSFTTARTRQFTGTAGTVQPITLTLMRPLFTQPEDTSEAPSAEDSGVQQGVIVGAAIGAVLCVLIVLMLMGFFIWRNYSAGKRRRLTGAANPNSFDSFYQPNQFVAGGAVNHPMNPGYHGSFIAQQQQQHQQQHQQQQMIGTFNGGASTHGGSFGSSGGGSSVHTVASIPASGRSMVTENYMLASNDGIMSARDRGATAMLSAREEIYPSEAYGISVPNDAYASSRRPTIAPPMDDNVGTYGVRKPRGELPDF